MSKRKSLPLEIKKDQGCDGAVKQKTNTNEGVVHFDSLSKYGNFTSFDSLADPDVHLNQIMEIHSKRLSAPHDHPERLEAICM